MSAGRSEAVAALLLAAIGAAGCARQPVGPPEWHQEAGDRWRSLAVSRRGQPGFTQLPPRATGVTFQNFVSDSALLRNQLLADGGGVAIGDVNGDGRPDIYLCRTEGANALYLNDGDWKFHDVAGEAGLALPNLHSTGAVLADVDGDGALDLLVTTLGGPNLLFHNDGHGRFTEDTTFPGRTSRAGSTTMTLADVDGSGALALYVANYKAYTANDLYSPQERAFDQVVKHTGPNRFEVVERYRKDYKVVMREDLHSVVLVQRADSDWFYLNDGKGHFHREPIARNPRFLDEDGKPLAEEPENFALAARFYDVNGDGAPDLYVTNDFEDPDRFWINDGHGRFRLIPRLAQRTTSNAGMAVDFADIDRDGLVDFFEVDMLSRESRRLRTEIPTHTPLPKQPGEIEDRPQLQRNTLFLNRGDGTFAQVAELAGVDATGWTWATMFLDVDLDGWEDLLVANGNVWDFMDADTQDRFRNRLADLDWRQQRMTYPRLAVPNYAFRNKGDLTFEDVSERWHFSAGPDISHGMAAGDLDGDGDLDVVINRLGAPALLLRNDATAPRIAVRLRGRAPNTQGIGANVAVRGGPVALQERQVTAGGLYLSSAEPLLSFAAGNADSLMIEVRWRDGSRSVVPNARPNRLYEIREPGIGNREPELPNPESRVPSPRPLFEDETARLGHAHTEVIFDDYARQLLLPNSFAQLGPGASWLDLDGDGADDLVIASGRTGTTGVFLNTQGRFVPLDLGLPGAAGDQTTILQVPDGKRDGGSVLLIGQSSYEAPTGEEAYAMPSVLAVPLDARGRRAGPITAAVPGDTASIGPLALSDYDHDGNLDLFVGGRIYPGAYPLSPSSRLFRNDGTGRFVLDSANSALLSHLGMVSAALFSDLNQDGWPDLVLAVEWGPVKVFWNNRGRFTQARDLGLDRYSSRWLGLASGDFDGDGRPDLVVTSWGRNVRLQADSARPLYLYFGNFGMRNTLDVLLARDDPRLHGPAPLAGFARLSRAVPDIAQRIRTFGAYADATVDQLLGPAASHTPRLGANTFDHLIWRNKGDHFEPHSLPLEAQLAPAFAPVVADFDGDGNEDLVLSQNFFPTDLGTPRYDAGRSLLLVGDGKGGFAAVPGQRSGLLVYGDQRGAAAGDYDGDGRVDVVITQNGTTTRLFRNLGARPGFRVRLDGPPGNPRAIGASLRLEYGARRGPLREVQAGSGYWSVNGAKQILGLRGEPTALLIRWPDGRTSEATVSAGAREVRVRW
ncbi:MAG TPA: FG-GAP-like repeat-containing protein [Gemmatimonadales bacterium]|nr:FG-GAP-like repeat-containing protein [Gemmatimonadales bacterium]